MMNPRENRMLFLAGLCAYCVLAAGSISWGGGNKSAANPDDSAPASVITEPELERIGQRLGVIARGVLGGVSGVDMSQIRQAATLVSTLLGYSQKFSTEASQSVEQSYKDLGTLLHETKMTDPGIQSMEKRLADMRGKSHRLNQALTATRRGGDQLFSLLEHRALDNGNEKLREKLLESITGKKGEFSMKVDRARNALVKLNSSIKNYDDILGYLQINRGLKGVDQYMADIDRTVKESAVLNTEIQTAIREGLRIIDPQQL